MRKISWVVLLVVSVSCFSCTKEFHDTDKITAKEKASIIKKITSTLKNDGYAFNQTFDDIDEKLAVYQNLIDTTTTISSFVSSLKPVFKSYALSHLRIRTPGTKSVAEKGGCI